MAAIAILVLVAFAAGPFVTLGIWLWLRSRREPVRLQDALDIGRVMTRTFGVFRNKSLLGLATVLVGLPQLGWLLAMKMALGSAMATNALVVRGAPALAAFQAFTGPFVVGMLALILCSTVYYIVALQIEIRRNEGERLPLRAALEATPRLFVPTFVAALLLYFGVVFALFLFIVPGVVLALSWMAVIPVLVAERTGIVDAFRRSRRLTIGSRVRIFVLSLLILAIAFALTMLNGGLGNAMARSGPAGTLLLAIQVVATVLSALIHAGFFAALYVELRTIREGMAVPSLAEVFA